MGHRRFKFWNRYFFPVLLVMGKHWTFLGGLRSNISIFGSFKLKLLIANPNKEVRVCTDPILQSIFEEADDDDDPGLDMEEFRVAMRRAMGPHLSDDEIDAIFMKVTTLLYSAFIDSNIKWNISDVPKFDLHGLNS